jgi:HD-GYP domain-containing protein (c-di-GMP phosphodiesterase class II)
LKGEDIPQGARIFAVVDTFDAMTSDRPYRKALTIDDARNEIEEWSGRQFDPDVAAAFLSLPADAWREVRERVHHEVTALEEQVRRVLG